MSAGMVRYHARKRLVQQVVGGGVEETLLQLLTWALSITDDPRRIVIESWPSPWVPLSVTVLNNPPTDPSV